MPRAIPDAAPQPVIDVEAKDVTPKAIAKTKDYSKYKTSSRTNALRANIVSLGPPGEGKTIFAASGSAAWPSEDTIVERFKAVKRWTLKGSPLDDVPHFETIVLEDMAWLAADIAPLAGLNEMGIECPHVLDLKQFMMDEGPLKACFRLDQFLNDLLPAKLRFLAFDTVSNADKMVVPAAWQKYDNDQAKSMAVWSDVARIHSKMHDDLTSAANRRGGNLHSLIHGKAVGDANALPDTNKWKDMAIISQEAQGKEPISGDITGRSANLYKGHANFMFVIKKEEAREKKPADELIDPSMPKWFAYTQVADWETKSRFKAVIRDKEVAHLGHIFERIMTLINAGVAV